MEKIEYIGCFFEIRMLQEQLKDCPRTPLDRTISHPHVTFAYHPEEIPLEAFGEKVTVRCVGYGCDGENEALQVEFVELPAALQSYIGQIAVPHITLTVSQTGRPVNSSHLAYQPIAPFLIEGTFGGKDIMGNLHL